MKSLYSDYVDRMLGIPTPMSIRQLNRIGWKIEREITRHFKYATRYNSALIQMYVDHLELIDAQIEKQKQEAK